ncbi:MAG: hypothetical protein IPN17_35050 [Deltaproteobacteria bacterium]|nr:hypothetical protein [Deltaproteobacteria bacterium]
MPGAFQTYAAVAHIAVARLLEAVDAPLTPRRVRLWFAARDLRRLQGCARARRACSATGRTSGRGVGLRFAGQRERAVRSVEAAVAEARLTDVTPDLALALSTW